jgi:putative GTP pyrophosphokinase
VYTGFGRSRRHINRAGDKLRDWWSGPLAPYDPELDGWIGDALAYRGEFQEPLRRSVMGLRSMVKSERAPVIVAQRLKRFPQILNKLARYPNMDLTRMQDIGGCRAVLPDMASVHGVRRRVERRWDVQEVYDYVSNPKADGYRGIHVVVMRQDRLIEVQLRTIEHHGWATAVEEWAQRTGFDLKEGHGPEDLRTFLERAAYAIDRTSRGEEMTAEFDTEFSQLRQAARRHLPEVPWL